MLGVMERDSATSCAMPQRAANASCFRLLTGGFLVRIQAEEPPCSLASIREQVERLNIGRRETCAIERGVRYDCFQPLQSNSPRPFAVRMRRRLPDSGAVIRPFSSSGGSGFGSTTANLSDHAS